MDTTKNVQWNLPQWPEAKPTNTPVGTPAPKVVGETNLQEVQPTPMQGVQNTTTRLDTTNDAPKTTLDPAPLPKSLEQVQQEYLLAFGKVPWNAFKNNQDRMQGKLDELATKTAGDVNAEADAEETDAEAKDPSLKATATPTAPVAPITPMGKTINDLQKESNKLPNTNTSGQTVVQIQAMYGITNDELYNDQILKEKYKLSPEQMNTVRSFSAKKDHTIDLNLNYHQMPDYIQALFNKYGFNGDILKDPAKIEATILGNSETPSDIQQQEIHQMNAYYAELKKNDVSASTIIENPGLKNPNDGWKDIPAL